MKGSIQHICLWRQEIMSSELGDPSQPCVQEIAINSELVDVYRDSRTVVVRSAKTFGPYPFWLAWIVTKIFTACYCWLYSHYPFVQYTLVVCLSAFAGDTNYHWTPKPVPMVTGCPLHSGSPCMEHPFRAKVWYNALSGEGKGPLYFHWHEALDGHIMTFHEFDGIIGFHLHFTALFWNISFLNFF